ncbi:methyl-accepting chemotaxis protein [Paraburkholderia caballeronis]|uniref:methyl-accepting chemotaxis protein n=1 Tax=Paraburkholderia caballeronis TaxID=416943 RepID=UPI001066ED10|nr:methyl-accepting chemotaxis protein [Paraburkholderia caballeronis]TDV26797.1 methyl-accepting chemotaxis protein [Paraburkholderia caballeronis]
MLNITRIKIGGRLAIGFGAVLVLLLALTAVGAVQVGRINKSLSTISELNGVKQRYAINFRGSVHNRAIALRDVVLEGTDSGLQAQEDLIRKLTDEYAQSARPLDQMFAAGTDVTADERADLARIKSVEARTLPLIAKVIALRQSGDLTEADRVLLGEARPAFNDWLDSINAMIDLEEKMSRDLSVEARSIASSFTTLMLALGVFAVLLGGFIAWTISRSVVRPITRASEIAHAVASGDLTVAIDSTSRDETGALLDALKTMRDSLSSVVTGVRAGTESVTTGAAEIAAGNIDLSSRTEEQAASLEQTAASMAQLTETVKQNADNAREANKLAMNATREAGTGHDAVQTMVATIGKIRESSGKISEINGLIEGIAFQTNILALNAAVEAARAGEQGRGFAVVAGEVRSLAQRSSAAAGEIKTLIESSVRLVEEGSRQAEGAGATMGEVRQAIAQVSDLMGEIASASEEQSRGIEQVNQAIVQMDETTQQNAAQVEEAAAAAQSLQEQAAKLKDAVNVFRVSAFASAAAQSAARTTLPSRSEPRRLAAPKRTPVLRTTKPASTPPGVANAMPPKARAASSAGSGSDDWETF